MLRTRPAKQHTPVAELVDDWRRRAAAHGFDAAAIAACHGHDVPIHEPDAEELFASLAGPDGICARRIGVQPSRRGRRTRQPPGRRPSHGPQPLLCGAARLEELADEFLASRHVLYLGGDDVAMFTTVEMLGVQDRIMSRVAKGLHQGASLVSPDALAAAFETHSAPLRRTAGARDGVVHERAPVPGGHRSGRCRQDHQRRRGRPGVGDRPATEWSARP